MIHRQFLGRSFSDPTFEYTRRACMDAAKTILREVMVTTNEVYEGPNLWIDQAFMVASGITLSLDLFHRKPDDPDFAEHRKLVETTIQVLKVWDESMIAVRGIRLLSSLLAEQARLSASASMDKFRKRAREEDNLNGADAAGQSTNPAIPHLTHVGSSAASVLAGNKRQKQKFDVPKFVENFVGPRNRESISKESQHPDIRDRALESVTTDLFNSAKNDAAPPDHQNQQQTQSASSNYATSSDADMNAYATAAEANQALNGSNGNAAGIFGDDLLQPQPGLFQGNGLANQEFSAEQIQWPGSMDLNYETFEQLFPAQAGMSNSFLFGDLLNFEL